MDFNENNATEAIGEKLGILDNKILDNAVTIIRLNINMYLLLFKVFFQI